MSATSGKRRKSNEANLSQNPSYAPTTRTYTRACTRCVRARCVLGVVRSLAEGARTTHHREPARVNQLPAAAPPSGHALCPRHGRVGGDSAIRAARGCRPRLRRAHRAMGSAQWQRVFLAAQFPRVLPTAHSRTPALASVCALQLVSPAHNNSKWLMCSQARPPRQPARKHSGKYGCTPGVF